MDLEPIRHESNLHTLIDSTNVILRELQAANVTDVYCSFVYFLICSHLDAATLRDYKNSQSTTDMFPTYKELRKFLQTRLFAIDKSIAAVSIPLPTQTSSSHMFALQFPRSVQQLLQQSFQCVATLDIVHQSVLSIRRTP